MQKNLIILKNNKEFIHKAFLDTRMKIIKIIKINNLSIKKVPIINLYLYFQKLNIAQNRKSNNF
jgi:hypothetical protein